MLAVGTTLCPDATLLTCIQVARAIRPLSNYTMVDLQWDMPIAPGDSNRGTISVNGTIENAIEQMELLYPGWNQTFHSQLQHHRDTNAKAAVDKEEPTSWDCNIDKKMAQQWCISIGIKYLRGLDGIPKNGPGPGNCGRVSCSYGSAIYWCNENNFEKEVTWNGIADGAEELLTHCKTSEMWTNVKGQVNYKDNWNVVVYADPC
ncbi:hypothetical protein B0T21DRAFT_293327 [Apiosordaria backusii]|uniref:Uncharacterized protein n=1 Tax=Apiosordaria backusii TaxID=314023 RepID=A0AA40B2U7_9PEZI|nr:hypothetical protein B0T21DRAFT_293327 [Apiosordaria backusii]